jgi:hypothetical protein
MSVGLRCKLLHTQMTHTSLKASKLSVPRVSSQLAIPSATKDLDEWPVTISVRRLVGEPRQTADSLARSLPLGTSL